MLERTARCLDPGARAASWQPLRHVKHAQRKLHSEFWRHGAGDLDLPSLFVATARPLFEQESIRSCTRSAASQSTSAPFLDFLYPPSARELLQRQPLLSDLSRRHNAKSRRYTSQPRQSRQKSIRSTSQRSQSSLASEQVDRRDDALLAAIRVSTCNASSIDSKRCFAGPPPAPASAPTHDPELEFKPSQQADYHLSRGEYSEELRGLYHELALLRDEIKGADKSRAVAAYGTLPEELRSEKLASQVCYALGKSSSEGGSQYIISVYESTPKSCRSPAITSAAIVAYAQAEAIGEAINLHDETLLTLPPDIGFSATLQLMGVFLALDRWQLLLHVYVSRRRHHFKRQDEDGLRRWSRSVEQHLANQIGLHYPDHVFRLVQALDRYPFLLQEEGMKSCVRRLVHAAYKQRLHFGKHNTGAMLCMLRGVGASQPSICEYAIRSADMLSTSKLEQHRLAMRFYQEYTQDYQDFKPSEAILLKLLKSSIRQQDELSVGLLVQDWQSHHDKLNAKASEIIFAWYSSQGQTDKAEAELANLASDSNEKVTWKRFMPLLYGDAIRGRPAKVQQHMISLQKQYGLEPSVVAFNAFLLAYVKAEDQNGLMTAFTNLLESGLTPDSYTFGTIMALTAHRGEVGLTKALRESAEAYGIQDSKLLDEELLSAHINKNDLYTAETLLRQFSNSKAATIRMWTQLLQAFISRHDLWNAGRIAFKMQKKTRVNLNQTAYIALMKLAILSRRPYLVPGLMIRMSRQEELKAWPVHYALQMHANAIQSRLEQGLETYAELLDHGPPPDFTVRVALLQLHELAKRQNHRIESRLQLETQSDVVEALLEEFCIEDGTLPTSSPDKHNAIPRTTLERLFFLKLLADMCGPEKLFAAVSALLDGSNGILKVTNGQSAEKPLRLLLRLMRLRSSQGDTADVERYWALAIQAAVKSASTEQLGKSPIPEGQRNLLHQHLELYVQSLHIKEDYNKIVETFEHVISSGFDLNHMNWNRYIESLLKLNHEVDAFVLCERFLMPIFPGWDPGQRRANFLLGGGRMLYGPKWKYKRFASVEPAYLARTRWTMQLLGRVAKRLQREASQGEGFAREKFRTLQRQAPRTVVEAVTAPRVMTGKTT